MHPATSSTSDPRAAGAGAAHANEMLRYAQDFGLGDPVVELFGIAKSYAFEASSSSSTSNAVPALRRVDLSIRQGEFVMIRGPSGGGKTSMLNIIGTLDSPTEGVLKLFGQDVMFYSPTSTSGSSPTSTSLLWKIISSGCGVFPLLKCMFCGCCGLFHRCRCNRKSSTGSNDKNSNDEVLADLRLRRIGFVFQSFNLLPTLSAFENVELPMTLLGKRSPMQRREAVLELLTMVGLEERASHLPSELSGGEQQRVAIARALANEPDILLLDEPTGDLDVRNTVVVMDLLARINGCITSSNSSSSSSNSNSNSNSNTTSSTTKSLRRPVTCVMVTHNPDLECYAHRIVYVADGGIAGQVVNSKPTPLLVEPYSQYLHRGDDDDDDDDDDSEGEEEPEDIEYKDSKQESESHALLRRQAGVGGGGGGMSQNNNKYDSTTTNNNDDNVFATTSTPATETKKII